MIVCKNCNTVELKGRQQEFCSDRCRMQFKRKPNTEPEQIKPKPEQNETRTAQVEQATIILPAPEISESMRLAATVEAERLKDLGAYGVSPVALGTSVTKVSLDDDGSVKVEPINTKDMYLEVEQPMIDGLPPCVSRPTGHRTAATERMTADQLHRKVSSYKGQAWIANPEYAEVIHRLLTMSIDQLEQSGQSIPAWKLNMELMAQGQSRG